MMGPDRTWKKIALRHGLAAGAFILAANILLTFMYLNELWTTVLGYAAVPILFLFAGHCGLACRRESKAMRFALLGGFLTIAVGLAIGLATLFLLTWLCMSTLSDNPLLIRLFLESGQENIRGFIMERMVQTAYISTAVAAALGGVAAYLGGRAASSNT